MRKQFISNHPVKGPFYARNLFIIAVACLAVLLICVLLLFKYHSINEHEGPDQSTIPHMMVQVETQPVPQGKFEDAADDPAIWINPTYPDSSRIIGTDKKGGLAVYGSDGNQIFYYPDGAINNADLRYGLILKNDTIDILGSFRIADGVIDGAEETDGLDVTNLPLGNIFLHGLLVVQDGSNKEVGKPAQQNFKLVNWDSVAVKFSPPLENQ